jgi:hypothetical protein
LDDGVSDYNLSDETDTDSEIESVNTTIPTAFSKEIQQYDIFKGDVVSNIPKEVLEHHGLSWCSATCSANFPIFELVSDIYVINGLLFNDPPIIPMIQGKVEQKANSELLVQDDGRLFVPGQFYGETSIYKHFGFHVKPGSRSHPWTMKKYRPSMQLSGAWNYLNGFIFDIQQLMKKIVRPSDWIACPFSIMMADPTSLESCA